jgi:hypothetical protein
MNTNDNLEDDFNTFSLSPESRDYLITSAKWAKIVAITSLTSIVISLLGSVAYLFYLFFGDYFFGEGIIEDTIGFEIGIYLVVIFIFTLMISIPFYLLYKFGKETNANLVEFEGASLFKGITYLKSFFKTVVLSTVIIMGLYMTILMFVGS